MLTSQPGEHLSGWNSTGPLQMVHGDSVSHWSLEKGTFCSDRGKCSASISGLRSFDQHLNSTLISAPEEFTENEVKRKIKINISVL